MPGDRTGDPVWSLGAAEAALNGAHDIVRGDAGEPAAEEPSRLEVHLDLPDGPDGGLLDDLESTAVNRLQLSDGRPIGLATAKGITREGSTPKLQEFMRICLKHGPVNMGDSKYGNILQDDITAPELISQ